jgi:hypothetical protein
VDPDSEDFVDPDPYWESGSGFRRLCGSMGEKIKKFQWKKCWIRIRKKSIRIHNPGNELTKKLA